MSTHPTQNLTDTGYSCRYSSDHTSQATNSSLRSAKDGRVDNKAYFVVVPMLVAVVVCVCLMRIFRMKADIMADVGGGLGLGCGVSSNA